jgi:hypothetical protein
MIVEDQVDRGAGRVGRIDELEELDELAATVTISDQGVHLAGQQVDAGKQADRAVALVFVVACEGCMQAWFGRQIGCRRCDRLDTRLLIVGDYGYRIGWFLLLVRIAQVLRLPTRQRHQPCLGLAKAFAENLRPLIEQFADEGMSMTAIATELNRRRIKTSGRAGEHGRWHSQTVKRLVARLATSSQM